MRSFEGQTENTFPGALCEALIVYAAMPAKSRDLPFAFSKPKEVSHRDTRSTQREHRENNNQMMTLVKISLLCALRANPSFFFQSIPT
ncbi:MAG: hypothetical protein BWX67_01852 [Thermotogae bacterium ADurb.Bin062]|nr:MAG: hypothetical protein BWX67_01852 [Thermotogota bacterium ADurb.Bin062]